MKNLFKPVLTPPPPTTEPVEITTLDGFKLLAYTSTKHPANLLLKWQDGRTYMVNPNTIAEMLQSTWQADGIDNMMPTIADLDDLPW